MTQLTYLSYGEAVETGIGLVKQLDSHQWALGDLALTADWVKGQHSIEHFAEDIQCEYATLKRYKWVCSVYEEVQRRTALSFWHHKIIASCFKFQGYDIGGVWV